MNLVYVLHSDLKAAGHCQVPVYKKTENFPVHFVSFNKTCSGTKSMNGTKILVEMRTALFSNLKFVEKFTTQLPFW